MWYRGQIADLNRVLADERDRYTLLEKRFLQSLGVDFVDEKVTVQTPDAPVGMRNRSWPERRSNLEKLDRKRRVSRGSKDAS